MSAFSLEGRTVLLTGASSGVGRALLRQLAAKNCRVVAWSRRPSERVAGDVVHEPVDLSDMGAIDAALDGVMERHPELSVVVNNAGVAERANFLKDDPTALDADAEAQIAVNLRAPIRICQHLFAPLSRRESAMIVNNTSGVAVAPTRWQPIYCATKAGLRSFTYSLRYQAETAGDRLKVVEILLPMVESEMTAKAKRTKMPADKAAERILRGMEKAEPEIWVGQAALLRRIAGVSPSLARTLLKKAAG